MKNILLAFTIFFIMILSGCGQTTPEKTTLYQTHNTLKSLRAPVQDDTDWTWFVGTDMTKSADAFNIDIYFMQGLPKEIQHLQYFLDVDNDAHTGFSYGRDSWKISGADYLIEDGKLYKSTSPDRWQWEHIGSFETYKKTDEEGIVHIHIATYKPKILALLKSDIINITIEPFDKNWGGIYSTISTQKVTVQKIVSDDIMILDASHPNANIILHDPIPEGAFVEYIHDDFVLSDETVVQTHTHGIENSFHFVGYDAQDKYQWSAYPSYQNKFFISWDGKFSEDFIVYVVLKFKTAKGEIKQSDLVYTPSKNGYENYTDGFMHTYLEDHAKDGHWHHYKRNILEDLRKFYPGATIEYDNNFSGNVNGFALRGSGRITNIRLSTQ